ncbi:MAG: arsenate reductase ArsC [Planctomycetaceae bacterium]|jgi:arsenate reductase (thioredoxin)|nr:arsenate reductase ArsC [Planctomycetaceae bacterium]MDC0274336.1 arsenate reductase ArsC [Planctomycetaceae bacterium]MDG2387733.1 arsenate reductase ArsC [Planctomycetaceae bacterium]
MTIKRLLFVCVENSNRSQMAEAFARIYGGDDVKSFSAGSKPSGLVNPKAVAAMDEVGYDLTLHHSKSLDDIPEGEFAAAITMGCGDSCPNVSAAIKEDWQLPDPRDLPPEEFYQVRDAISKKVKELLERI